MDGQIAQSTACLALSAKQGRISLAKFTISEKYQLFLQWRVSQWFDFHLQVGVISQGNSPPNAENCSGFPHH